MTSLVAFTAVHELQHSQGEIVPLLATASNSISLAPRMNFVTTTGLSAATSSANVVRDNFQISSTIL